MRKATAIFFMFIANVFLLAHAVVPHHHHSDRIVVCLTGDHCSDNDTKHDHDEPGKCDHKGSGDIKDCVLNNIYLPTDNNHKTVCSSSCDHGDSHDYIQAAIPDQSFIYDVSDQLPFRHKPFKIHDYSVFISHSIGLRGPPRDL